MALSDQNLPYVFPGELHPLQIDIFAVGDKVLPALHVDWVRKLTSLAAQAIEQRLSSSSCVGTWSLGTRYNLSSLGAAAYTQ